MALGTTVQTGHCNQFTLEDIVPIRYGLLAGKCGCLPVLLVINDLFKIVLLSLEPDHSKV